MKFVLPIVLVVVTAVLIVLALPAPDRRAARLGSQPVLPSTD